MKKSKAFSAGILAIFAVVLVFAGVRIANANPSQFSRTAQTATATTSPSFLQAVNATSTAVIYDSYNLANSSTLFTKTDSAALLLQIGATTTPTVNITYEYAHDGPADCTVSPLLCDWYSDNYSAPIARTASSLGFPNMWTITPASATSSVMVLLPTPTRYVRVRVKTTNAPASVWAQIVPAKEMTK